MPTASLRAPEGYHLPNAMVSSQQQIPDLFIKFGGHPCAAGFSIDADKINIAKECMSQAIAEQSDTIKNTISNYCNIDIPLELQQFTHRKEIIWLHSSEVTPELLQEIIALDPFGQDFALPNLAFCCEFWDCRAVKWLGQDNKHFKIPSTNGVNVTFFNIGEELLDFALRSGGSTSSNNIKKQSLWVIAKPVQNAWRNTLTTELIVDKFFLI
jgi:single-stranded DNA-specific DHH superfamily exonuclease